MTAEASVEEAEEEEDEDDEEEEEEEEEEGDREDGDAVEEVLIVLSFRTGLEVWRAV